MKLRTAAKGMAYYLDFFSRDAVRFKRRMVELDWLRRRAQEPDTSFAGEFKAICEALEVTGQTQGGWCVDLAASDGVIQSSTLPLFRSGWRGLAIEMDARKFSSLAHIYADYPEVNLLKARVVPDNVGHLFRSLQVPMNFDVFNLDIDSYDLDVLNALLTAGYRPCIISMEVNEKIPPPLCFSVLYSPNHVWKGDHFFGCSLSAATGALKEFNYGLKSLAFNNAIFVDLDRTIAPFVPLPPEIAWRDGYLNRLERKHLFPWNSDVEVALTMTPEEAKKFFDELFESYEGRYQLFLANESAAGP
jgi:hypothetical protein